MSSLAGKVALVTGGNSGIGLATARAFHANGANVVISGRDHKTLEEVSRQLGHHVLAVPTDVTKLNEIDQLMACAFETFGKLDIRMLVIFLPGGLRGFFEGMRPLYLASQLDMQVLTTLAARYGLVVTGPPLTE
jgi:NAD(P)-dependent dehydrogenase (short-subunit alcohol dehydrogenase family)